MSRWDQFSDLDAPKREVRFAPINGHRQLDGALPKSAMNGSRVCFVWGAPRITNYQTRGSLIRNDAPR
jgi:hypothetical protein